MFSQGNCWDILCDLLKTKYRIYYDKNSDFHELIDIEFKKVNNGGIVFCIKRGESSGALRKEIIEKRIVKNKEYIENIREYLFLILKVLE